LPRRVQGGAARPLPLQPPHVPALRAGRPAGRRAGHLHGRRRRLVHARLGGGRGADRAQRRVGHHDALRRRQPPGQPWPWRRLRPAGPRRPGRLTPMSSTTRIAAWQCEPGPLDVAGNLSRLDEACAAAAARRAEVLVTPEMFTSGYAIGRAAAERLAENPGGPAETAVAEIARRHGLAVVYGHPERAADGRAYNAATMVGADGAVRGRHRKVHLFGDVDREQFAAGGERPATFGHDGSRVGMLICYDVEFPESVRSLALGGARTVLVPT